MLVFRSFALIALLVVGCVPRRDEPTAPSASTPAASAAPAPRATSSECAGDADCRVASDYCEGCRCRALARDAGLPKCSGAPVACLVDPCRGKGAVCLRGACAIAEADAPAM